MSRHRQRHRDYDISNPQRDLHLQIGIFLWTLLLMIILLTGFFFQTPVTVSATVGGVLVFSTIVLYIKFKRFYTLRDRGQRTWCAVIALYISFILTSGCLYVYGQTEVLTWDYGLVFLFGFLFFTDMAYKSLSRTMVVGNKRVQQNRQY